MKYFFNLTTVLFFCLVTTLTACGGGGNDVETETPDDSINLSFPFRNKIKTLAEQGVDISAELMAGNGEGLETTSLTISDATMTGTMQLAPGTWDFELEFYGKNTATGNLLPVAFVLFEDRVVDTADMGFTYNDAILEVDFSAESDLNLTASFDISAGCGERYDCDGDSYTNFAEFEAGSDPEDANSTPEKEIVCGDGTTDSGEECDDGNSTNGDGCNALCKEEICGNGTVDANEGCDDGNTGSGDGCNSSCKGESCGNGTVDANEQCDDGNTAGNDGCSSACKTEKCGDGVRQSSESCDDGNMTNGDGCNSSCASEVCGNGTVDANEGCDDGNTTSGDGCNSSCKSETCGDGTTDSGEECDDGNATDNDGCSSLCKTESCGDGVRQSSESCDDGNMTNGDGCNSSCASEVCGNGTVDANEGCDDGNTTSGDGCSSACKGESCGDGTVDANEQCDDGDSDDADGCTSLCKTAPVITLNVADGETVQDTVFILAQAESSAGINFMTLTEPTANVGSYSSTVSRTGVGSLTANWDTSSVTDDTTVVLALLAEDENGNQATLEITVTVDNIPNTTSFGTDTLIQNGESASLTWSADNYSSLSIDNGVGTLSGDSGLTSVSPTTTTIYTLTATRNGTLKNFTATSTVTISVNYNPELGDYTTVLLGQDPASGVAISWNQTDDTDGLSNTVTATVTVYEGLDCSGNTVGIYTSTTGSISPTDLDPRTNYSYTVSLDDGQGGSASGSCRSFTTSDTGLVGWWRMDGDLTDSSGQGHVGVYANDDGDLTNNFGDTTAPSNRAVYLDGERNHYVKIYEETEDPADYEDFDFGTGDYTLELWVNIQGDNADITGQLFVSNGKSGLGGYQFMYGSDAKTYMYMDSNGEGSWEGIVAPEFSTNSWHHVVAVRENSEVRLYIDGDMEGIGTNSDDLYSSDGSFFLGADFDGWENLYGFMDEVAIYKGRALTTQEIRDFCWDNVPTGTTCAADDVPAQIEPANLALDVDPASVTLSWEAGTAPDGLSVVDYHVCYTYTPQDATAIDGAGECANESYEIEPFRVIDSLTSGINYYWKVQTCYDDGACSDYSPVWSFSTL